MDRNVLISYAIKYKGDYNLIKKAISQESEVELISCDNAITMFDKEYPKCLFDLLYPPFVLFYKGNIDLLNDSLKIGVVGSRSPCEYSLNATRDLCLKNEDKVIISGLAKGIDRQAHLYAKKSIGVLGCGIDYIYPYSNKDIIDKMKNNQLIISEYPSDVKPLAFHFPFRNRIIAALSDVIYIMELKERSGTMTSVNEALELGKEIKVLPFDIYSSKEIFNNKLIQEGSSVIDTNEIFV